MQVGCVDESADEWAKHGTHEDHGGEDDDGDASLIIVEHVGEDCSNNRKGARAEEASEESTDHECLGILGRSCTETEDGKSEHGNQNGKLPALELGERPPNQWSECVAQNVE